MESSQNCTGSSDSFTQTACTKMHQAVASWPVAWPIHEFVCWGLGGCQAWSPAGRAFDGQMCMLVLRYLFICGLPKPSINHSSLPAWPMVHASCTCGHDVVNFSVHPNPKASTPSSVQVLVQAGV